MLDPGGRSQVLAAGVLLVALAVALAVAAGWHLTQGTSDVGFLDLWDLLLGRHASTSAATRDVLLGSRLPRVGAAVAVGFALGVAGTLLQSLARNALAAPDTVGVTAGAYFAVATVAAFGLDVPIWASTLVAFVGGLAAAALVLVLSGAAAASTTRLLLAGSAVALALQSATAALLILFKQQTGGLFAWGSGSLSQLDLTAFSRAAPLTIGVTIVALVLARRLDLLALGDDTAAVLGVPVRSTRAVGIVLAVLLTAGAVTLAGPIGFIGLAAPVATRLLAPYVPALHRHALRIPTAGLVGALAVVLADALLRALLGATRAIAIPTGVTTTLFGAVVMVVLARRSRTAGARSATTAAHVRVRSTRRFVVVLVVAGAAVAGIGVLGLLAGSTWLRTGDIVAWLGGDGAPVVRFALDERAPRVAAALAAGAALALSGTIVQATCRNPLAEPGLLGVTGGAGLAAVLVVTKVTAPSTGTLVLAAVVGAVVSFGLVYALSWRDGLDADRLILVGIGSWYGTTALSTYFLLETDPFNTPRIYTWLSGTTYGRSFEQVLPAVVVLAVTIPLALWRRRDLDLLAIDEDLPRVVGLPIERVRLLLLGSAAVLAATSVAAVGVVGFVGLVAPHAARALVGGRHARVVPVSVLLGAALLGIADTVGRTVIAPAQLPAGLAVALIGTPYFVFLLLRSRA
ncbi:iron ABC transporter permease [Aquihabitans sp. G128]|uniref:iron ABC transporter permease n=1 Tax=Aquihabitans sp. G128 TaxID=2849779 RepID=UPI00352DCF5E